MIAFIVTPTIYNFPNGFFVTRKKDSSDSGPAPELEGGTGVQIGLGLEVWKYRLAPYHSTISVELGFSSEFEVLLPSLFIH